MANEPKPNEPKPGEPKPGDAPRKEVGPSSATRPASFKGNDQAPEADRDPVPTFRTDMGEGLPPQKDQLNPDRAK